MTALGDLIQKLEQASEGSRELDHAIWAVGYKGYDLRWRDGAPPEFLIPECYCGSHPHGEKHWRSFGPGSGGPSYTTSLDAALTLVPDKHFWCVDHGNTDIFDALVTTKHHASGGWVHGATPALALCIAALKARAAQ